nr:hypothetical protein [Tanacetum cinerariifolium]
MNQPINEAVRVAVQIQINRLRDAFQKENDEFLQTVNENMKKIIKEQKCYQERWQVYNRVQISIGVGAEDQPIVHTSQHPKWFSQPQKPPTPDPILKRRREEDDDQEGPSVGSDRGSKRQREGGEHASTSTPSEQATGSAVRSTTGTQSRQLSASESAFAEELPRRPPTPDRDWNKSFPAAQGNAQSWISTLAKQTDARSSFNELLDTPIDFSNFIMNRLGASSQKYTTSVTKTKAADYGHIKWIEDLVPRAMWIQEPINYDKHALWGVSHWDGNVSSSTGSLLTGNLPSMYTPRGGSSLSPNSRLWNGTTISISIGYRDGTLNDVRNTLDDRLKGIRMHMRETFECCKGPYDLSYAAPIFNEDPPLDQTGGLRGEENERSMHQPALHLNQLPRVQADEQRNLYKALVEAYDADKTILDAYGESAILKRRREDDDQEGPSAGSDRGSTIGTQSRQMSASESAFAEEPVQTTCQMEEPSHPVFETGAEDQPIVKTSQHPEWFSQPRRLPTSDRDWNKTLPAAQGNAQSWRSTLAKQTDARSSFNELLDTPIDFSNFIMNRLGVDTLTPDLLAGPTYELMRGLCNSLTEPEYHLEEVYKATTDQL